MLWRNIGPELLKLADENKCDLFYEASVGGGIPLIRTMEDGLASDRITCIDRYCERDDKLHFNENET